MTSFARIARCFNTTRRHGAANQLAHRFARFDRFTVDAMPQKGCLWKIILTSAEVTQRLDLHFA
jgi:hypothetical protein